MNPRPDVERREAGAEALIRPLQPYRFRAVGVRIGLCLILTFGLALVARGEAQEGMGESSRGVIAQWPGQHGGSERPRTRVLREPAEWAAFWQAVKRDPPRALDVGREMAVAIELGGRPTAGFTAEIISAGEREGSFVVAYRERRPAPDSMVAQVLTEPWVVAVVPRSNLPVVFQRIPVASDRQEK